MNISCLIVDDERPALQLLKAYIDKLPHLDLTASCENGMQALAALQKQKIDLMFLDVQMPDLTGLELLQSLTAPPLVVLTTAYRDFAVEGFSLNVTDYLVKPFSFNRFVQAVNKASLQLQSQKDQKNATSAVENVEKNSILDEQFFVKTSHKMVKLRYREILYVESMREYVSIQTVEKRYVIHQTMNKMEEKLPGAYFMRVHRSYIIAIQHIDVIHGNTVEIKDKTIPIGGSYRKDFINRIALL